MFTKFSFNIKTNYCFSYIFLGKRRLSFCFEIVFQRVCRRIRKTGNGRPCIDFVVPGTHHEGYEHAVWSRAQNTYQN